MVKKIAVNFRLFIIETLVNSLTIRKKHQIRQ